MVDQYRYGVSVHLRSTRLDGWRVVVVRYGRYNLARNGVCRELGILVAWADLSIEGKVLL